MLWGVMAAVLNFVPYLGAATGIAIVGMVSLMSSPISDTPCCHPPPIWPWPLSRGKLITPLIHSVRFTLNPVAVLLALFFWGWIWGVPGALLAVPLW